MIPITITEFKDNFFRDFPYLSVILWLDTVIYNINDLVFNALPLGDDKFYVAIFNATQNLNKRPDISPNNIDFWAVNTVLKQQDFILDIDIQKAFDQANMNFNQDLFGEDANIKIAFFYLSAYYLVIDITAASSGLRGSSTFMLNAKSAGNVSSSYTIPERYINDPFLSAFTKNPYGEKYLSLLLPRLVGRVRTVSGATTP